jgi:hypothetical protein
MMPTETQSLHSPGLDIEVMGQFTPFFGSSRIPWDRSREEDPPLHFLLFQRMDRMTRIQKALVLRPKPPFAWLDAARPRIWRVMRADPDQVRWPAILGILSILLKFRVFSIPEFHDECILNQISNLTCFLYKF